MEPINYILDVQNPIEQAMRGYGMGRADIEQRQAMQEREQTMGLRATAENRAAQEFEMRRAEAERQRAQAEAGQAELLRLMELGDSATTDDYTRAFIANPAIRQDLSSFKEMLDAPKLETMLRTSQNLYAAAKQGNVDAVRNQLTVQFEAAKNSGDEAMAATYGSALEQLNTNPEMGMNAIATTTGFTILDLEGPDYFKAINETLGVGQSGGADVQSSLPGRLATVIVRKDGTVEVRDNRTNEIVTGAAAEQLMKDDTQLLADVKGAVERAGATARLEAAVDLGALAAAAEAGGQASIKLAEASSAAVAAVRSNIGTIERAIELVEQEGANTGVIARNLPSWNASTIELNNLQGQLTIDVIGAVTFGALSEGELALAMDIALPTGLDEKELADWLRRKKTAQQKLANYHSKKARFFSDAFSIGQWEEFIESGETDMRAWMDKNVPGPRRRTTAPTTAAPTGQGLSAEDLQYLEGN